MMLLFKKFIFHDMLKKKKKIFWIIDGEFNFVDIQKIKGEYQEETIVVIQTQLFFFQSLVLFIQLIYSVEVMPIENIGVVIERIWSLFFSTNAQNQNSIQDEKITALRKHLQQLRLQNQTLAERIRNYEVNATQKDTQITDLSNIVTQRDAEIMDLRHIASQNESKIPYLQGQVTGANQNFLKQKRKNNQLDKKINLLSTINTDLKNQLQEQRYQLRIVNRQKDNLQLKIQQQRQSIQGLNEKEKEIYRFQSRKKEIYDQNQKHLRYVDQMEQQIEMLNLSLEKSNNEAQNAYCQNRRLRSLVYKIENQKLFEKSIFLDQSQKQELVTAIRIQAQDPLKSTKSLYFSSWNEINERVLKLQQHHSYAFVAKTFNGKYLAAVSLHLSDKLLESLKQNRDFMIDLADKRNFYLKEGKSALFEIIDDDLIFGKDDLKVQITKFKISTNLGQDDSNFVLPYWEAGIFGEHDSIFDIESFQVFELFLADGSDD